METSRKGGLGLAFIFLLIGIAVGALGLFGWNYYKVKNLPQTISQEEQKKITEALVAKVGAIMLLPKGETPLILVIDDVKALAKENTFYKNASNGDRVLVYQKAAVAIIYSPEKNLIINVGPVFTPTQQTTTASKTTVPLVATTSTTTKKK